MVNVTNRPDVAVRLRPRKLFLGHDAFRLLLEARRSGGTGGSIGVFRPARKKIKCGEARLRATAVRRTGKSVGAMSARLT
jgi:hypothetical protein